MRTLIRGVLCASAAAVVFAALGVAMIPTSLAAPASQPGASLHSPQVVRPLGPPSGCNIKRLVSPASGLSYQFTVDVGLPVTVHAEVYEYASYNLVTDTYSGCNRYTARDYICAEDGLGPNGAIWLYDVNGMFLNASTPSPAITTECSDWSGWTNTVYSASGVKAKLGARVQLLSDYYTHYPFPSSGTYHL